MLRRSGVFVYAYIHCARSRVENYRVFPHVKRNTRNFFFTPVRKRRDGGERKRERREFRRNANGVLFHPRAPPTLARAIYGLSRYRRNIRTLTTLYIYNGRWLLYRPQYRPAGVSSAAPALPSTSRAEKRARGQFYD